MSRQTGEEEEEEEEEEEKKNNNNNNARMLPFEFLFQFYFRKSGDDLLL